MIDPRAVEFCRQRKTAYQLKFGSGEAGGSAAVADMARADLEWFCRANASTWSDDARHHARLEGRREVWLRIWQHLTMEPEVLAVLYGAKEVPPSKDEEPWEADEPT